MDNIIVSFSLYVEFFWQLVNLLFLDDVFFCPSDLLIPIVSKMYMALTTSNLLQLTILAHRWASDTLSTKLITSSSIVGCKGSFFPIKCSIR